MLPGKPMVAFVSGLLLLTAAYGNPAHAKVRLNWWIDHAPQEVPLFASVVKAFEERNPGIEVKLTNVWGAGYYDKLTAAGAAGTMPDVFYARGGSGDTRFYARGMALDLTPFVKKDWKSINGADFLDAQVEELRIKGKWMALPYDYSTMAVYYNRNMLSQAGLPMFGDTLSWNDVINAGAKLLKVDGSGRRTQTAFEGLPLPYPQWLEGMMLSDGARLLNDKEDKCLLDSAESMRYFQFVSDLVHKHGIGPRANESLGFMNKKSAMNINGSWDTIVQRKTLKFPFDVTSLPCSDPSKRITSATGGSWAIGRATKHPQEAWRLVKFATSPEMTRLLIVNPLRSLPSRKSLMPEWSRLVKQEGLDPKNADAFWTGAQKAGRNSPVLPFDYKVVIDTMYQEIRQNRKGIDQILKTATQQMNIELDKAKKRGLL